MKSLKKWSPIGLPIVLVVGIVVGWMVIQQARITFSEAHGPQKQPVSRALPASSAPSLDGLNAFLSCMNPFRVEDAEAGTPFTLTLSHTLNRSSKYNLSSASPYGLAHFFGVWEGSEAPSNTSSYISRSTQNWGDSTSETLQGYVVMSATLPADGWYIVSLNACTPGIVSLRHYEGGAYPVLQAWTLGVFYKDYPHMAYFSAGTHHFFWSFSDWAYVTHMTVNSYP